MSSSTGHQADGSLSDDDFGHDIITLYVGPKRKRITIHKKLLTSKSEHFRKLCNDLKGEEDEIYLKDENLAAFELLRQLLYRGEIRTIEADVAVAVVSVGEDAEVMPAEISVKEEENEAEVEISAIVDFAVSPSPENEGNKVVVTPNMQFPKGLNREQTLRTLPRYDIVYSPTTAIEGDPPAQETIILQDICAMRLYSRWSREELRTADYLNGRRYGPQRSPCFTVQSNGTPSSLHTNFSGFGGIQPPSTGSVLANSSDGFGKSSDSTLSPYRGRGGRAGRAGNSELRTRSSHRGRGGRRERDPRAGGSIIRGSSGSAQDGPSNGSGRGTNHGKEITRIQDTADAPIAGVVGTPSTKAESSSALGVSENFKVTPNPIFGDSITPSPAMHSSSSLFGSLPPNKFNSAPAVFPLANNVVFGQSTLNNTTATPQTTSKTTLFGKSAINNTQTTATPTADITLASFPSNKTTINTATPLNSNTTPPQPPLKANTKTEAHQLALLHLLLFASKASWPDLFNSAMTAFHQGERILKRKLPAEYVVLIYSSPSPAPELRRFAVQNIIYGRTTQREIADYVKGLTGYGDFLAEYMRAVDALTYLRDGAPNKTVWYEKFADAEVFYMK